ncbi:hypothetical protein HDU93_006040 [Gonapodya sp. JEL0774]|nr:hypothetical protein HDU93_006040 [Gonapodya sp. JEL0774]
MNTHSGSHDLPSDLFYLIAFHLGRECDARSLCTLRLVSREWDNIAACELVRVIRPRSINGVKGITKILSWWKRMGLDRDKGSVREVDLQLVQTNGASDHHALRELLAVTPLAGLRYLYAPQIDHPSVMQLAQYCPNLTELAMPSRLWKNQHALISRLRGVFLCPDPDGNAMDLAPLLHPDVNISRLERVGFGAPRDSVRTMYIEQVEALMPRLQALRYFQTAAEMSLPQFRRMLTILPNLESVDFLHGIGMREGHLAALAELRGTTLKKAPCSSAWLSRMPGLRTFLFPESPTSILGDISAVKNLAGRGTIEVLKFEAFGGLETWPFAPLAGTDGRPAHNLTSAFERILEANPFLRVITMSKCPNGLPPTHALAAIARYGRRLEYLYIGADSMDEAMFESWLRCNWHLMPRLRHVGRPYFHRSYLNIGVIYERDSVESGEWLQGTPFWKLRGRRDVRRDDMWGRGVCVVQDSV